MASFASSRVSERLLSLFLKYTHTVQKGAQKILSLSLHLYQSLSGFPINSWRVWVGRHILARKFCRASRKKVALVDAVFLLPEIV